MRDYGRVYSSFWQSPEARGYSETGRLLALYLLTSPHANLIGCFRLPDAYAADDLQWSCERVKEGFTELSQKGFLTREDSANWVFIHKYLKWNEFENGNVAIAAWKAFDQVPSIPLKLALAVALLEFGCHIKEAFVNHLQTLLKPFANPVPEPEPVPEPLPIQNPTTLGTPPDGGAPDEQPAKKERVKKPKSVTSEAPSAKTWDAYSAAYEAKYHCKPVRNAKVNGQLAQVVARLGAEDSPAVAEFFLTHKGAFYASAMHRVDLLLRDCEKLHTEWVTGRQAVVNIETFKERDQVAKREQMAHDFPNLVSPQEKNHGLAVALG